VKTKEYIEIKSRDLNKLKELIEIIENCGKDILISIDGNSGSGKTYYSNILSKLYDCNVIHIDSFYLPKGKIKINELGGNIDYYRLENEVLKKIHNSEIKYREFDCKKQEFGEEIKLQKKRINIIEGSYSQNKNLKKYYDVNVFVKCDEVTQLERIMKREGERKLIEFKEKWIPMENDYFQKSGVNNSYDILIKN